MCREQAEGQTSHRVWVSCGCVLFHRPICYQSHRFSYKRSTLFSLKSLASPKFLIPPSFTGCVSFPWLRAHCHETHCLDSKRGPSRGFPGSGIREDVS